MIAHDPCHRNALVPPAPRGDDDARLARWGVVAGVLLAGMLSQALPWMAARDIAVDRALVTRGSR